MFYQSRTHTSSSIVGPPPSHPYNHHNDTYYNPSPPSPQQPAYDPMVHRHPHTNPNQAHAHTQALQYFPDQQPHSNPVYAHPNSYPPKSSSTCGGL